MNTFLLTLGPLFIVFSILTLLTLFIPALGKVLHFRHLPYNYAEPAKRRAAYFQGFIDSAALLIWGLNCFSPYLIQNICDGQQYIKVFNIFAPVLAIACSLIGLNVARRAGLYPAPGAPSKNQRRYQLIGIGVSFLLLIPFFWLLNRSLDLTFERIERVQMLASDEGWAVGRIPFTGVILHYSNGSWRDENTPYIDATDISMISAQEGWAVGSKPTMLHYYNGVWEEVPVPADNLHSIAMLNTDQGWAVGDQGVILHYSNGQWQQVASPTTISLQSVAVVSDNEAWAVGGMRYTDSPSGVILHYQQGSWQLIDIPGLPYLARIDMLSEQEGWVVGGMEGKPPTSIILHYLNGHWRDVPQPSAIPLSDISMSSAQEGWAVGGDFYYVPLACKTSTENQKLSILLHYVNGSWEAFSKPSDDALRGVSMLSKDEGLIVGWNTFLRYQQGQWRPVERIR